MSHKALLRVGQIGAGLAEQKNQKYGTRFARDLFAFGCALGGPKGYCKRAAASSKTPPRTILLATASSEQFRGSSLLEAVSSKQPPWSSLLGATSSKQSLRNSLLGADSSKLMRRHRSSTRKALMGTTNHFRQEPPPQALCTRDPPSPYKKIWS